MDVVWGIASYQRPERQNMLNYLHRLGYPRDRIIISTQTKEDYELYSSLHGAKATIIYKEASNCPQNKNTILDYYNERSGSVYCGTRLVMCSDKTESVEFLGEDGKLHHINTKEQMDGIVERGFKLSQFYCADLWGVYTTDNTYFMSHTTSINGPMLGCFMGIANPKTTRFNEQMFLKEDFEIIFRTIQRGGCVVRFNDLCLKAKYKTKGGSHSYWHSKGDSVNESCNNYLLQLYPNLAKPNTKRSNEIRYVGPASKIKYSLVKDFLWHTTHPQGGAKK